MNRRKSKTVAVIDMIKTNKTSVITALCFIVGITIFIIFAYTRIQIINNSASDKLDMASRVISSGNIEQGLSIMEDIITNYNRTPAAYRAMLMKSNYLISQKKYDEAEQLAKNIIEHARPDIIKPLAYPLLISIYDDNNNLEQAIAVSNDFLSKYADNYLAPSVMENMARLYELSDKKEEARQVYKDIADKYFGTLYANRANAKLK